jgi:putative endopeptidase
MKKRIVYCIVALSTQCFMSLCLATGAASTAEVEVKKSSEIPEKRSFDLDLTINPCDDFHAYVCSKAENSFQLREDRSSHIFAFSDSSERILESKKSFFKNIDSEKKLKPRTEQMRAFYKACMNESVSIVEEKRLVGELMKEVDQIKSIDQFIELNTKNLVEPKWSVIGFSIDANIDNPLIYDVYFDLNIMYLPEHSYYENADLLAAYNQLIVEFFKELKIPGTDKELAARAQAMIDYEKAFVKTYPYPAEFRQRWTQPRQVTRDDFFKLVLPFDFKPFFAKNIPKNTKIRDFIPESWNFFTANSRSEDLAVLKDMYIFRNARTYMDDAYPELYKKRQAFAHKFLGGSPVRPDRQERCTSSVMGSFNRELDMELQSRLFPHFPEQKMRVVAEKIRKSILQGLKENSWLSPEGKKMALEKIRTAKLQLISPKTAKEWDFKPIAKYSETSSYENSLKLHEIGMKRVFEKLRSGVNQQAWGMGPLTVNAYYSPDKNKFVMPIGILQFPFFAADGDVIENLGAVGAVVGHELGHSIDDQGSKFDSGGRLKQWMTDADLKNFSSRSLKMIEQFNKIGHNGQLTLGENVGDLVGLTFAYNAAFPADLKSKEDQTENKKKFFTAYARVWCGVMRDKTIERQLKTDPHSLGYARINEQVKHQRGFQEAYKCNSQNKLFLAPDDQIKIW